MSKLLSRLVVLACVGLAGAFALADDFDLSHHTISGGGGTKSTGGAFELSGTIGQPAARTMANGEMELTGGFWFETPPGDCNFDGITNLAEYGRFTECATGPIGPVDSGCECFDTDRDGDVDLADFGTFQRSFNGQ